MYFSVGVAMIVRFGLTSVLLLGTSDIICNAWISPSSSSSSRAAIRLTSTASTERRTTTKPATSLRSAKDDDDDETKTKEKNYSPYRASWKTTTTTTAAADAVPATPKKKRRFPKFEAPKMMSMPEMPDLPNYKFEAPKMPKIDMPDMNMPKPPKMPEFTIPKMEAPKYKFPARSRGKTETKSPWGDTRTNNTNMSNNSGDKKANYSRQQASWKTTTTTTTAPAETSRTYLPKFEFEAPKISIDMTKMPEMQMPKKPTIEMPSMPAFDMPKLEAPKYNLPERSQRKIKSRSSLWEGANATFKTSNNSDTKEKKNYSPLRASWKTETTAAAPRYELPTIALPDLSSLGLPDAIPIERYSDEARRLSLQIDKSIKDKINAFTGRTHYKVGDISKAIIAKVANEEFELAEITFFFRILIAMGVDLSGFGAVLPVSGLVGMLGWSISMGLAERVTQFVAVEINKRVKEDGNDRSGSATVIDATVVEDASTSSSVRPQRYSPGDLTKSALLGYTGKSSYAAGDLASKGGSGGDADTTTNSSVLRELEECLAMEKALIEKLDRIQRPRQ